MKDLHTHLLYGIDDGCKSIEDSIEQLKHLSSIGVTEVVLTPHYINNSQYSSNNKEKLVLFNNLKGELLNNNININLYLGNEIFIDDEIDNLINNNEIKTINNTRYVLVELPLYITEVKYLNTLENLIYKGYKVILAHVERYPFVINDYKKLTEYMDMGIILQGNITSLYGKYGKKSQKVLKRLIKKGWISFLASDIHRSELPYNKEKLVRKLKWYTSKSEIIKMLETNFDKVINDLDI